MRNNEISLEVVVDIGKEIASVLNNDRTLEGNEAEVKVSAMDLVKEADR